MMEHKVLVAEEAGSGHACGLSIGLRKFVKLDAIWEHKSAYGLDRLDTESKVGLQHLPDKSDGIIIVGVGMYDRIKNRIGGHKSVTIIITDGGIMRKTNYFNSHFNNFHVFATPCKIQFREGHPTREYYQPFDININIVKNRTLTVAHSPYGHGKWREKGTEQIIKESKGYNFDLISGVTWLQSIYRKSKCHIFVDQIDHFDGYKFGWRGGVGKSGYEAMLVECLTISRGKFTGIEIPAPPIAWCDKYSFGDVLKHYAYSTTERNKLIEKQKEWATKYLDYEYQAKRILDGVL